MRSVGRLLFAIGLLGASGCGRIAFDLTSERADASCAMTSTFHADVDGDGHGDPASVIEACTQPVGAVTTADDCDDREPHRYPGATEVCDGIDNDCNAATAEICPALCVPTRRPSPDDAHTYLLCGAGDTWPNAKAKCENEGFYLAAIADAGEQTWLRTTMDATHGNVDIFAGGNDLATEGDWRWPDGTAFWQGAGGGSAVGGMYVSWAQFEPNDGNGGATEDCLLVLASGAWNDATCDPTMRPYACERD